MKPSGLALSNSALAELNFVYLVSLYSNVKNKNGNEIIGLDWKHFRQGISYIIDLPRKFPNIFCLWTISEWIVAIKSISIFLNQFCSWMRQKYLEARQIRYWNKIYFSNQASHVKIWFSFTENIISTRSLFDILYFIRHTIITSSRISVCRKKIRRHHPQ